MGLVNSLQANRLRKKYAKSQNGVDRNNAMKGLLGCGPEGEKAVIELLAVDDWESISRIGSILESHPRNTFIQPLIQTAVRLRKGEYSSDRIAALASVMRALAALQNPEAFTELVKGLRFFKIVAEAAKNGLNRLPLRDHPPERVLQLILRGEIDALKQIDNPKIIFAVCKQFKEWCPHLPDVNCNILQALRLIPTSRTGDLVAAFLQKWYDFDVGYDSRLDAIVYLGDVGANSANDVLATAIEYDLGKDPIAIGKACRRCGWPNLDKLLEWVSDACRTHDEPNYTYGNTANPDRYLDKTLDFVEQLVGRPSAFSDNELELLSELDPNEMKRDRNRANRASAVQKIAEAELNLRSSSNAQSNET